MGHAVQYCKVSCNAHLEEQPQTRVQHERGAAGGDYGGEGHQSDRQLQPKAWPAMQEGRADSIGCPRTDHKGVPLQGQRCVPEPVQTIRPATLGIFSSSLGPLDIETLEKVQKRAVKAVSG